MEYTLIADGTSLMAMIPSDGIRDQGLGIRRILQSNLFLLVSSVPFFKLTSSIILKFYNSHRFCFLSNSTNLENIALMLSNLFRNIPLLKLREIWLFAMEVEEP